MIKPKEIMKTILKMSVYVRIETSKNIDRATLSKLAESVCFPAVKEYLAKAKFSKAEVDKLETALGVGCKVDLLTEIDLVQNVLSKG
jgi:hypothetical protein